MIITTEMLNDICSEYGDSFYLLDTEEFLNSYNTLLDEFKKHYSNSRIAYSYKTNYIPRLCGIVDRLGGYAEVVSDMEYELASRIGVEPSNIFYNGPYKNKVAIEKLLIDGGVVNADSGADLKLILQSALSNPNLYLRVGIRCNFDISDGVRSRFGFNVENGDFDAALDLISTIPNLVLEGLHCHFASRSLESWENATKGMLLILSTYHSKFNCWPKFVSLGGGLYGEMDPALKRQLGITPPSFEDYASASAKPFSEFFSKYPLANRPILIIEPGTALAANSLKFVTQVVSIKSVGGKYIATVSGSSFNTNPTSNKINLPMTVFSNSENIEGYNYKGLDLAGYTCIETDYLFRSYDGPLSVGDFVVFDAAGSYSVVMKPPFILPQVPILELGEDGSVVVVKRQETFDDVFRSYEMVF
jgi:diaminopimelate decarboxylase